MPFSGPQTLWTLLLLESPLESMIRNGNSVAIMRYLFEDKSAGIGCHHILLALHRPFGSSSSLVPLKFNLEFNIPFECSSQCGTTEDYSQLCSVSDAKVFMTCVPTRAQRQLHQMELFHSEQGHVDVILLATTCEYDPNTYGKFIQTDIKQHHLFVGLSFFLWLYTISLAVTTQLAMLPDWDVCHLQVCVYRWKG